ncbi:HK97 family phage prohead protease [Hyphomonas sp.]|uniref:HK97 family phage prohead protease n=1 Tax=Hyphomonas sp. TaxID=87 RepID=UPI0025C594A9|nr:HK97 family phage prohead protease [Hyphomonas sp.]MBI1401448.1 HK97 family phage prohead protease [Hyphomonas sp.]
MLHKLMARTGFAIKRTEGVQFKDYAFKLEGKAEGREFEGYGSVFGVVDSYNEIVAAGAFAKSIAEIKASSRALPVLWNHNSNEPIGKYLELTEDAHGLKVRGELLTGSVQRAREVAELISAGVVSGLSIGFWPRAYTRDDKTGIVTLTECELREISAVTFPANGEARIETIKAKLAGGGKLSEREFEKLLRDAGLSRTEAIRTLRAGFSGYSGERDAAGQKARLDALADLRGALQTK